MVIANWESKMMGSDRHQLNFEMEKLESKVLRVIVISILLIEWFQESNERRIASVVFFWNVSEEERTRCEVG